MNSIISLLAWRYIRGAAHEQQISGMVKVCFIGMLVSSFALTLILCIMQGFEQVTYTSLRGIHAPIMIRAYGDQLNVPVLTKILHHEFPEIAHISTSSTHQAIVHSASIQDLTLAVAIKGIDPAHEQHVSSLEKKIIRSHTADRQLSATVHNNYVIIGSGLAAQLHVNVNDQITLLYANNEHTAIHTLTFDQQHVLVGGIFTTGIEEFDLNVIFCAQTMVDKLWPDDGITQLNLAPQQPAHEERIITALRARLGIEVISWKDLYPALVAAIALEKYVMVCILMLILLIAASNMVALEYMHSMRKQGDIAMLQMMGMQPNTIRTIFRYSGMLIALIAIFLGVICAVVIGYLVDYFACIPLPDAYYVSHLPVVISWHNILLVMIIGSTVAWCSTWFATRSIGFQSPLTLLRHEA